MKAFALTLAALALVGCMGNKIEPPYITPQSSIYGAPQATLAGRCLPAVNRHGTAAACIKKYP